MPPASVRESQRRAKETNLRENRYWAGQLSALDRYGLDLTLIESYGLIEGWSAEQVREAAARYLSPDNYVQVSLFPEESWWTKVSGVFFTLNGGATRR